MTNNKQMINEMIKSTLLTLALFSGFDILIQGYNNYHHWIISLYIAIFSLYHFLAKRYL